MKIFETFRSKRYLRIVYAWIGIGLIVLMAVFSLMIYFGVKNTVEENIYESNKHLVAQIQYNLDSMGETIKNLNLGLFSNADVKYLMYNRNRDIFEETVRLDNVKTAVLGVYSFVHSFYVYNNELKSFYSSYSGMNHRDANLENIVRNGKINSLHMPLYRKFKTIYDNVYENVFTYVMYDWVDSEGYPDGAIFINIDADWIFSNLRKINIVSPGTHEQVFLVNKDGELISDKQEPKRIKNQLMSFYSTKIKEGLINKKYADNFSCKFEGESYFVNYMYIEKTDWILIYLQPYKYAFRNLIKVRNIIIIMTGVFLIAGIVLAYYISGKVYNPIGKLVKQILSTNSKIESNVKNEIEFLSNTYRDAMEEVERSIRERNSNDFSIKKYYLRQLLSNSSVFEFDTCKKYFDFDLSLPKCVCVFKIDNFREFIETNDIKDRELYKFAIENIAGEILGGKYNNNIIDVKDDTLVALVSANKNEDVFIAEIKELLFEAQKSINTYYRLSTTVSVSSICIEIKDITKIYNEAINNTEYRIVFGKSALILPDMVKANKMNTEVGYPQSYDRKVSEKLGALCINEAKQAIADIIKVISRQNADNIIFSIMHLLYTLRNTALEVSRTLAEPVSNDFSRLKNQLVEMETMEEIQQSIYKYIDETFDTADNVLRNDKYLAIVETMKEIAASNYPDSGLALQNVAAMLKLSSNYIGKIFKDNIGVSFAEYLNQIRIEKAAEWLRNSDLEVGQIMQKVGIDNESSFYRNFKKHFILPPKEYAVRNSCK